MNDVSMLPEVISIEIARNKNQIQNSSLLPWSQHKDAPKVHNIFSIIILCVLFVLEAVQRNTASTTILFLAKCK